MSNTSFKETIVDVVLKKLKDNLPDGYFKTYYYGDVMEIPESSLPCVIVYKDNTDIVQGPTGKDVVLSNVVIILAYNKRNDWGNAGNEVAGTRALEQYAEGLDPTTGEYHAKSVAGILRANFTLSNRATDQNLKIEYGITGRPKEILTAEARINCEIEEYVTVTMRT
jgi:hypothetical protein